MYFLDNDSGVGTMPPVVEVISSTPRWFTESPPSYPGAAWFNIVQAELMNAVKDAGIELDKSQLNQLSQVLISKLDKNQNLSDIPDRAEAVKNLGLNEVAFIGEILHRQGNLYEIFIAGAGAQADSRKNLGLKIAATYDVGTGSGQIPDMSSQQKGVGAGFGWQKLPSGLIFQWGGTAPIAGSGSSVNVSFPIEFPNAVVGVVFQSITEVSPSCAFFMHSDLTTSSMKAWGVAKVIAAGATTAPLSAGISASWLVWGY